MRLFNIDPDDHQILLNKEWVYLIPEFLVLIRRDKGSDGDYDGRKKLKARRELTFIYFNSDFASPITDWEDAERKAEALYYAGLKAEDLDEKVLTADKKYQELVMKGTRSLRTYKAMLNAADAFDTYLEKLDFAELDKKGELKNSPDRVAATISKLSKMHDEIAAFRKKVEEELKSADTGIRGTAELGDSELKKREWSEEEIIKGSEHSQGELTEKEGTFSSMMTRTLSVMKTTKTDNGIPQSD